MGLTMKVLADFWIEGEVHGGERLSRLFVCAPFTHGDEMEKRGCVFLSFHF